MSATRIRPVEDRRDLERFIRLPWRLYAHDPHWVPPLLLDVRNRLDRAKNPFFEHAEAAYFLAERDGAPVGRIAAILDRRHQEVHGDRTGFFGWLEMEDDPEVASALLDAARAWLSERGCDRMRGPASFSLNDECGLLVEGFDRPPAIMTPYNPPAYVRLIEGAGLEKVMDLESFDVVIAEFDEKRVGRIGELVARKTGATVRRFDRSRFDAEVERIKAVYNRAWEDNWGFVPMTDAELDHMARELRPALIPELACFVEIDGETVGFSLILPDANVILRRLNGRLLPFGFLRLLWGLKRVPRIRLVAMGIVREHRAKGLDALLYLDSLRACRDLGKTVAEVGWVLETNKVMSNTILKVGGRPGRKHRLYEVGLSA